VDDDKSKRKRGYWQGRALAETLYFTDGDLESNAEGEITDHQMRRLQTRLMMRLVAGGFFVVLIVAPTLILPSRAVVIYPAVGPNPVWLVIGLVMLFMAFTFGMQIVNLWRDLRERRAEAVEGPAMLDIHYSRARSAGMVTVYSNRGRPGYTVSVGGLNFRVDKHAFLAFKNGDPYVIYYAPHSKLLLSAAPLDDDPFE
jgi:hypothetical protein